MMTQRDNLIDAGFQQIREQLGVPREFPAEVLAAAETASTRDPLSPEFAGRFADLLDIPFITIDPPGSQDLDQAFFAVKQNNGYQLRYAIDDVGFFVDRGGVIEQEAWRRGQTLYSPDVRTPLYPPSLSEGAASLLPGQIRPSIVFTFSLNARAELTMIEIARALIRSRAQLNYPEVSAHLAREREQPGSGSLNGEEWSAALSLLEEIGRLRQAREAERGGVSLRIPTQQVERWSTALTGYRLAFETASEVEEWNAQISLLTGMAAAKLMIEDQAGLLRALDPPRSDRVEALRLTAKALGVAWPESIDFDGFVRSLNPKDALQAVMLHQAARVNGAAHYIAFTGEPPVYARHAAVAAWYAHVTAPLRRLADRYALDLLVALAEKKAPDGELLAALDRLPRLMADSDDLARRLESALVDFVEVHLMEKRIGEVFNSVVIALRADGAVAQITDPPIRTLIPASVLAMDGQTRKRKPNLAENGASMTIDDQTIHLGQSLRLRLESADAETRILRFSVADQLRESSHE